MVEGERFTHFDDDGNARMVDVGSKEATIRQATAGGRITLSAKAYGMVREGTMKKGDVLGVARIAAIMGAKKVDQLIPLCHPLALSTIEVGFSLEDDRCAIAIEATVGVTGQTGVEMEALTAVSIAALTIYDMCKAVDKTMEISDIRLLKKSGGRSGVFSRDSAG